MRHWINTVSLEHVQRGVEGGFTQSDHGRSTRLKRLDRGDLIAFYSPRTAMRGGAVVQAFTAIGRIADDEPFQVDMSADFHPWRRSVDFLPCRHAQVRPLVESLTFVADKLRWGYPFRRGLFEVPADDFVTIASAMDVEL